MSSLYQLAFAITVAMATSPVVATIQEKGGVQGEWSLNRDLTPAAPSRGDDVRRLRGRPPAAAADAFREAAGARWVGGGGPPGGGPGAERKDMAKIEAFSEDEL